MECRGREKLTEEPTRKALGLAWAVNHEEESRLPLMVLGPPAKTPVSNLARPGFEPGVL